MTQNLQNSGQSDEPAGPDPVIVKGFKWGFAAARESWLETAPAAETTARRRYTTSSRLFSNGFLDTALGVPYEPAVPAEPTSQYVAPRSRGLEIE